MKRYRNHNRYQNKATQQPMPHLMQVGLVEYQELKSNLESFFNDVIIGSLQSKLLWSLLEA